MRRKFGFLLLLLFSSLGVTCLYAQTTVKGKVIVEGTGLSGVTVSIKNANTVTVTGDDGSFSISGKLPFTLVFSSVGFANTEHLVTQPSNNLTITLKTKDESLEEVVLVGYGTQSRKTVTGAISKVSADQIKNVPMPSPDQLLQGRSTGVTVSAGSGEPGTGVMVRVRGATSINASSDPLYVIDGVPIVSQSLAQNSFGQSTNPMADLNPSDIESMEILKDASATAIYGARAANGVILITTKRGKSGKPIISISSYAGSGKAWKDPTDLLVTGEEFETLQNEGAANNWIDTYGSITATNPAGRPFVPPYADPQNALNVDWVSPLLQTANLYNVDASVAGGNERIKYMVSGNLFEQEGLIRPSNFGRKSFRANLDFKASDALKFGTSLFYSNGIRNRSQNGNSINSSLANAFFYPSNQPLYNADGSYNKFIWESPLAVANETDYRMSTDRFLGNFYGDLTILPGLSLRSNWSMDYSYIMENNYSNTFLNAGASVGGTATNSVVKDFNWINENTLTYQFKVSKSSFNVLAGNTMQKNTNNITSATGSGFPGNSFKTIAAAAVKNSTANQTAWGIASYFGRIMYDWDKKYMVTANFRYDGSSRFGENNRWGFFPSASVGWNMAKENFMQDIKVISDLKWRVSYGVTGNQSGIGNFASRGLWGGERGGYRGGGGPTPGSGSTSAYVDYPGFSPRQLANPDLKWETTAQFNIGLDVAVLDNKIRLSFDYYDKQTKDMLLEVPVPRSIGYSTLLQNYGEMENKGFEVSVGATPVSSKNFNWDINFNISRNNNLIKKLAAPINTATREYIRMEEGYPLFSFYVHEQLGVDPATGDIIWNTGKDDVFNINTDRFIIGKNAWPKFQGGFSNNFTYKNVDLSVFFQYSYGNSVFNYNRYFFEHGGTRTTGYMSQQLDRWQQPGDITDIPRMNSKNYDANLRPSRHVEDASYLRLKNISLGYNLPSSLISKIGASKIRVYVAGQNVLTFTKYTGLDPEVSGGGSEINQGIDLGVMPQLRTWMGGINLTF